MGKLIDLAGERFGRLKVVKRGETIKRRVHWECACDCGNMCQVRADQLRGGVTQSCGCLREERLRQAISTHGMSSTRIYHIWRLILDRCNNQNDRLYKRYGGRGIKCEFKNFEQFYRWSAQNGYRDDLTIDRIDNEKGYSPKNCRWITNAEQQLNKRNNRLLTYSGKTQTITEWARELGIPYHRIQRRIKDGWEAEDALIMPKMSNGFRYNKYRRREQNC